MSLERETFVKTFWDTYQDSGLELASRYFQQEVNGNLEVTQALVPYLVEEGYARGVDMIEAVKEMQKIALEEMSDADGTDNDGDLDDSHGSLADLGDADEVPSTDAGSPDRTDES